MARQRVTRRTDSHGRLKDVYRDSWDREAIDTARKAGIPEKMLESSGSDNWRETGDTIGLWSELVYVLSDCLRGVDHLDNERRDNLGIVEEVFSLMLRISQGLGIDFQTPGLIPWEVWHIRRELSPRARTEPLTPEEAQEQENMRAAHSEAVGAVLDAWGCPSDPGHDEHGHGLHAGHWACHSKSKD